MKPLPVYTKRELRELLAHRLRDKPDASWKTHEEVMAQARLAGYFDEFMKGVPDVEPEDYDRL